MVDLMHQTMLVEMVIIILHRILVAVVVLLIMELLAAEYMMAVVLLVNQLLVVEEEAQAELDKILSLRLMVVMVEQVLKLHGFPPTYQIYAVNQDHQQECGTAVVVEEVLETLNLEDLAEIIPLRLLHTLEVVLDRHPYQTIVQFQQKMLSMHQVVVEVEELVDQLLLTPMNLI